MKQLLEALLVHSGVARVARRMREHQALILAYHNIVPRDHEPFGDPGLHLPQETFATQLDHLAEACEIVPLTVALQPSSAHRSRPRAAITFDDAYQGAITAGLTECVARGVPATVCVAPGRLGEVFWWDGVSNPSDGGSAAWPADDRETALWQCGGNDAVVRAWALDHGYQPVPVPAHARAATEVELHHALALPGVTVASHSWGHPNLVALNDRELAHELDSPLAWLRERYSNTVDVLAYPYGLASARVRVAVRAAGYAAGLRITGGWWRAGDHLAVPRVNVPAGLSLHGFELRTAGLFCA